MREPDQRRSAREGSFHIKQLWQRSHEIIGLALQGHNQKVIAEILNVSEVTVGNTLNSDLGMEKLSNMRKKRDENIVDVQKEVAKLTEKALKVYDEIFDSETASLNLKKAAADTVSMDLAGHRAPTKIDTRSLHLTATAVEIEEFKVRGIAAAREAGMLVVIPGESDGSEPKTETE